MFARPSRRRPRPEKSRRSLSLESLEARELMASEVFADHVMLVPDSAQQGQYVLTIDGTANKDTIKLSQSGDNLKVSFNGKSAGTFSASSLSGVVVSGGAGNDTISLPAKSSLAAVLLGGDGNDKLTGGGGSSLLVGGEGNDKLTGKGSADMLLGGGGNDTLDGGAGNDQLYGDAGDDKLSGKKGNDLVFGGLGTDKLSGKKAEDYYAEGNVGPADQALRNASPVHQAQEFLDETMGFLNSILPDKVYGSWKADAQGLGFKGGYNSESGFQAGITNIYASESGKASVAASLLGTPSITGTASITPNGNLSGMVSGTFPLGVPGAPVRPIVVGSLTLDGNGSMQVCVGAGAESGLPLAQKLSANLQACVNIAYSSKAKQTIVHDDSAAKPTQLPAQLNPPAPDADRWAELVDDVMNGLATQVPEPDPWTWNVPDPDMPFISSPDPWSEPTFPIYNYDPAPYPDSSLDPNFFGPYTDPFTIGDYDYDYGYGNDSWWSTPDYGYSYDDGATYDYSYSYDNYGYDDGYSYDTYDYGSSYDYGYSSGGSYGSGGSGSSIYYDDYA